MYIPVIFLSFFILLNLLGKNTLTFFKSKMNEKNLYFLIAYNMAEKILGHNTIPNHHQISAVNNRETFGNGRFGIILLPPLSACALKNL